MSLLMTYTRIELNAINSILASIGQAPVTAIDNNGNPSTPTNPDVAMAYNTLIEVSEEVQSEGWTFNQEKHYPLTTDAKRELNIPPDILQIELTRDQVVFSDVTQQNFHVVNNNYTPEIVQRDGKIYDKANHTYKFNKSPMFFDIMWLYKFDDIPAVIRDFITARAAAISCMRMLGDGEQYQMLQQREIYCRAQAIEYETTQGEYSYFGQPPGGGHYQSYQPYKTLYR